MPHLPGLLTREALPIAATGTAWRPAKVLVAHTDIVYIFTFASFYAGNHRPRSSEFRLVYLEIQCDSDLKGVLLGS